MEESTASVQGLVERLAGSGRSRLTLHSRLTSGFLLPHRLHRICVSKAVRRDNAIAADNYSMKPDAGLRRLYGLISTVSMVSPEFSQEQQRQEKNQKYESTALAGSKSFHKIKICSYIEKNHRRNPEGTDDDFIDCLSFGGATIILLREPQQREPLSWEPRLRELQRRCPYRRHDANDGCGLTSCHCP